MRLTRSLLTLAVLTVASIVLPAASAFAFGTVNSPTILGQRSEHERITRLALQCANGEQAPACFQRASLDNVAGEGGTFGAVGAADNLLHHANKDADFWHCDNADYLQPANNGNKKYPQSRDAAMSHLRDCLKWGRIMLYDGAKSPESSLGLWLNMPPATPAWGAVGSAASLLDKNGNVNVSDPGSCTFNGIPGNDKCDVLEAWGYVLHMGEDFYSHTNWADKADPSKAISTSNPPGLGNSTVAPFLDLRNPTLPSDGAIPADFSGGCFSSILTNWYACRSHVAHSDDMNKDKELINTATGVVSDPVSPRSKIVVDGISNGQRAVNDAVAEARRQWDVLRGELIQRYGLAKGTKMACVLTMDQVKLCDSRNIVAVVDTSTPARKQALAAQAGATPAMAAAQSLIGDLTPSDRVSVLTFDSATGAEDADPFVAPSAADVTRGADTAADPSTEDAGTPPADDPSVVVRPDAPSLTETPADAVAAEGDHESPGGQATPVELPAQEAPKGADPQPASSALPKSSATSAATANSLSSAAALLDNDGAPSGQRGIVLSTNRLGDTDALVKQIDALADAGTSVSLVLFGGSLPDDVIAAVERANGVALALPAGMDRASAAADAVLDAGLTRLTDPMGGGEDPTLAEDNAPVTGITDAGDDQHTIAPLEDDATLVVRSPDAALKVVVTDAKTGRSKSDAARPGEPAQLKLDADGDWDVEVRGASGNRYTATVS